MSVRYSDITTIQTESGHQVSDNPYDISIPLIDPDASSVEVPNYMSIHSDYGNLQPVDASSESSPSGWAVFKKISGIGIPMGLSFTFSFEVFLTVLLLQRLSESDEDTAAATVASTMMSTVCTLLLAPIFSVAICLSNKLGAWREEENALLEQEEDYALIRARQKESIESTNINALLLASVLTVPAVLTLYYSQPILTTVFRQEDAIARSAAEFLRIYGFAVPALATRFCLEQIFFSFGETKAAMWMALGSFSIGASLSVLLGFGIRIGSLQFPRMERQGIALGFVLESYLTAILYGCFVKLSKQCRQFDFYTISIERIRRNLDGLEDILRLGGAITFTIAIELALTLSITTFSGLLGTKEEAAMAYCMQFIYFEYIMLAALSITCTQEISRELGAKRFIAAQKTGKYGLLTTMAYILPLPVLFGIYPKALEFISGGIPEDTSSSGTSEDISDMLNILVPIMSFGVILDSIRYNILQQSRALNDLLVPNLIALIGMSSGIALAAALGFGTSLGIYGLGIGSTVGVGVTAGVLSLRWWDKINPLENAELNPALAQEPPTPPGLWGSVTSFFPCLRNRSAAPVQINLPQFPEDVIHAKRDIIF